MVKLSEEANEIMAARFGKDTVISLATANNRIPYVRNVNAYYENGAFYIITHMLSNKMKQIEKIRQLELPANGLRHMEKR